MGKEAVRHMPICRQCLKFAVLVVEHCADKTIAKLVDFDVKHVISKY